MKLPAKYSLIISCLFCFSFLFNCQKNNPNQNKKQATADSIVQKTISYSDGEKTYISFIAYKGDSLQKKPVVLVIPEWWGNNDYAKKRAIMLAELGYFAMAMDFYGDGKVVEDPKEAGELATPFYDDAQLGKLAFDAGRKELAQYKNADASKIAVIGYCFGGAQSLNMARQEADLKGAVVFHGNLMTGVKPNNNKVKILVLNGEADTFISQEEIAAFRKEMDSAQIAYSFHNYPNAIHAFTNPAATEIGKKYGIKVAYNKEADQKSWEKMKLFLKEIFQ